MSKKDLLNAKNIVKKSNAILVIVGAGMSVESGIPTYRGNNGLWEKEININGILYECKELQKEGDTE